MCYMFSLRVRSRVYSIVSDVGADDIAVHCIVAAVRTCRHVWIRRPPPAGDSVLGRAAGDAGQGVGNLEPDCLRSEAPSISCSARYLPAKERQAEVLQSC